MTYVVFLLLYKTKGNYLFKIKSFAFRVRLRCVAYCVVYTYLDILREFIE